MSETSKSFVSVSPLGCFWYTFLFMFAIVIIFRNPSAQPQSCSPQRLGCDPLRSSSPRYQFKQIHNNKLQSSAPISCACCLYARVSKPIMQAMRHIARDISYLKPIGRRTSDSAYSLQMHACRNACTCRRWANSQCVRLFGSCWSS